MRHQNQKANISLKNVREQKPKYYEKGQPGMQLISYFFNIQDIHCGICEWCMIENVNGDIIVITETEKYLLQWNKINKQK